MLYKDLSRTNDAYTPDRWSELWDLFKGGYYVLDNAGQYLPQVVGENPIAYKDRIRTAAYQGYFGPIVNMMVAQLFGQELAITPASDSQDDETPGDDPADVPKTDTFYREFAKNADTKDTPFPELCKAVLRTALVQRCGYIGYDTAPLPKDPKDAPQNRAEEEKQGLDKLYAFQIDPRTLIDWETDDDGEYTLAVIQRVYNRRIGLTGDRSKSYMEFKCWIRDPESGVVSWELYRTKEYTNIDELRPEDDIERVESGTTSFPCIPILPFQLPDELWVGNQIGPMNREHFKRRSELVGAEQKSLFEIGVFKLAPEMSAPGEAIPSEAQQNPHRGAVDPKAAMLGRGALVIGSDDDFSYAGPSGAAYTVADTQIKELVDEMYRVVAMMAQSISSTTKALGRSGQSKEADANALTIVLREFGNLVRKFAVKVYEAIADARKDDVVWQAHGLENYDEEIRADLIMEAIGIDAIAINSPTWKRHYKTSLAYKLTPEMDPETKEIVRREIIESVEAEESIRMSQQENEGIVADAGPTPEELGKAPPGGPSVAPGRSTGRVGKKPKKK